jgi:hypothetical protein
LTSKHDGKRVKVACEMVSGELWCMIKFEKRMRGGSANVWQAER